MLFVMINVKPVITKNINSIQIVNFVRKLRSFNIVILFAKTSFIELSSLYY